MLGFLKSAELSGNREGLRRPCRFQPLCLWEAWPPACSLPLSVLTGSCLRGQLHAFSSCWWMGFSDCFFGPKADLRVSLHPS